MILERVRGETYGGEPQLFEENDRGRLRVTVVFTNIEGTLGALKIAARLATGLGAEIAILVTEVVSFRYMLESPPEPADFFHRLCGAMVKESKLDGVRIDVRFCREQVECLKAALRPRSIVVIGATRSWWPRRERELERALNQLGFDAVLVPATARKADSQLVVQRLLEEAHEVWP